jgi:very-short-patch-repair endonuclease
VVALSQLRALGLSKSGVAERAKAGRLHRIHRGVYAVGHPRLTKPGRWMAAVLACGPRAVLSHRSAAGLWGLRPDNRPNTDVSLPLPSARPRAGLDVHATTTLRPEDTTSRDGIPCTTVARTLLDLADVVPPRTVERAVEQAEMLRLFDMRAVEEILTHANGRRGAAVLRNVLADLNDDPGLTANDLEDRFLELCRAAGLPRPKVNQWLELDDGPPIRADFLWRRERLIVETDGWDSHGTRQGFERDRLRDQRAQLAGWRVLRFTRRQVLREPDGAMATTGALLAR